MTTENEYQAILNACREIPASRGNYHVDDYVLNLMSTILDYQLDSSIVSNALTHYKSHHWDGIRTRDDLAEFLAQYPNDQDGNTAAATNLWGYRYSKRLRQLRELLAYFDSVGVSDQEGLRRWAEESEFDRDFQGRVKGLAFAVYQWLVMRQGLKTIKPDVHIKRFLTEVTNRAFAEQEAVSVLKRVATELGLPANELDWSIWDYQRSKRTQKRRKSKTKEPIVTQQFVPPARLRGIQKSAIRALFDRALPGSINLGLGEPDLPTPQVVRREAARVATEEQNGYTTHAGLPALRALIAGDYPQMAATAERVVVTAGSQEALYLALMSMVDAGDEVLLPDPGFVAYPTIVRMAGGVPVFYRLPASKDFSFDAEDFRRKLSQRTKVVVAISPSNPTGRVLSRDELAEMSDALRQTNARVISDEIYRELYYTRERPASISEFYPERTIVISGLSKSMSMTGWRLGWMCGEEAVIKAALVLHGYVVTCASALSQKAALAAWTEDAARAREVIRETFRARRDFLLSEIDTQLGARVVAPDGAFYAMLDVSAHGASMEVAERLLAARVITVPGDAFGAESEGYLRISFCADKLALAEGVRRIKMALDAD